MTKITMSAVQNLIAGHDSVKVKLEGKAKVGRGGIFVNYPIRYEGKQPLKF
jgi:hypothetical protein